MSSTTDANQQQSQSYASPPVTIVLTIILLIFFFIGFFSIYFCRCFMQNLLYSLHIRHSPSGTPVGPGGPAISPGLDPSIIKSFPTFTYSSVKEYRREKYGLECAICLCEFLDDDTLRLLTLCNHVFHEECVDLWLESHKSCPVCRTSLDTFENNNNNNNNVPLPMQEIHEDNESSDGSVCINIRDDDDDDDHDDDDRGRREEDQKTAASVGKMDENEEDKAEKFSRSKTTGHSIVRSREEEDKFTLRLPEHVRAKLIRGHKLTRSCTSFGEFKSKRTTGNGGFGEVSGLSGGNVNNV